MSETERMMNRILKEIEGDGAGTVSGESSSETEQRISGSPELEALTESRRKMNELYEVKLNQPISSGKPVIGRVITLFKRTIRKLMSPVAAPVLLEQNRFNASAATTVNLLSDNQQKIAEFIRRQEEINLENQLLKEEVERLRQDVVEAKLETAKARKQLGRQQAAVLCPDASGAGKAGSQTENGKPKPELYGTIDYVRFEDYFRGSQELIRERQSIYLPYFRGRQRVIDLGCGRGEFLELLHENGVSATGVEQFSPFVQMCREKGLPVVEEDAVAYVNALTDGTVDGIFAGQLIEHLETGSLVQLCNDAWRKLAPGGYLIMETPNPRCLTVYTNAFYIDPSHNRPVHPLTLEYILKEAGFTKVDILFTECSREGYRLPLLDTDSVRNLEEVNEAIERLSDLIYGSQDYAVVAQR